MASYRTTGIVLGRTNFGEADRVVTFFTLEMGKVRAVAKGVRKIRSRVAGHVEPFSLVELMLVDGRSLDIITSARLLRYPMGLSDDYDRLGCAYVLGQLADRLTEDKTPHPELFELLSQSLDALQRPGESKLIELRAKLQLLSILGYHPQLGRCIVCGSSDVVSLSVVRGGVVCAECRGADVAIDQRTLKLWRLSQTRSIEFLSRIEGAEELAGSSLESCDLMYDYHFGRRFVRPVGASV